MHTPHGYCEQSLAPSVIYIILVLTSANEELYFNHLKHKTGKKLAHQYSVCVEVDIDADTPATCWLSTW